MLNLDNLLKLLMDVMKSKIRLNLPKKNSMDISFFLALKADSKKKLKYNYLK